MKSHPKPKKLAPSASATPPWNWQPWAWAAAAIVLVFWAYGGVLHGDFVFDDTAQPYAKPASSDFGWWIHLDRPVLMATYWLNHQLNDDSTYGYHVINLLIHLVSAGLMFLIIRRFLEWAKTDPTRRNLLAGFAAGLFLLHPAMSEAVAYISGRSESLSTMFALAALAVFIYRPKPAVGWGAVVAIFLLFGLAVESKQQTVALPALFLLIDFWFNPGFSFQGIRANWKLYLPMIGGAAMAGWAARNLILHGGGAGFGLSFTWYQYLFTEFRALLVYIGEFLLPINLNGDWVFPISKTILDHGAIFALIILLALAAAAWILRRRFPLASFGFLAYLVLMSPTSSILPIADPVAERRLYFSALGLLLIVVDLIGRLKLQRQTLGIVCAILVAVCAFGLHARAAVWDDDQAFWSDVLSKAPDNARAHFHIGFVHADGQHYAEALPEYSKSWELGYHQADLLDDWGIAYLNLGQPEKALQKFQAALQIENGAAEWVQMGDGYAAMQRYPEALEAYDKAQKLDISFPYPYLERGKVHLVTGQCAAAIKDFHDALATSLPGESAHDEAQQYLPRAQSCAAGTH